MMEPEGNLSVKIHAEISSKINYACFQCSVPFLRDLRIENAGHVDRIENLIVTISSNPSFLKSKSWIIDRIIPGGEVSVKDRHIELIGDYLTKTESTKGSVNIKVAKDECVLAEESKPIELLAYSEWGGIGYMPELLAAFSMPNDPAVDRLLHEASLILRKAGKSDGIDGYKSKSRQRVWEIASAIYSAIANLGLTYAVPPASFERDGQTYERSRPPGRRAGDDGRRSRFL